MASSYSASVVSADKLPKLTMDNFITWKTYITAALQERELWSYVAGDPVVRVPSPPIIPEEVLADQRAVLQTTYSTQLQEYHNKDRKARAIIVLSVSEAMLIHTQPDTMNARDTWNKICSACQPKGMATKSSLLRQLWHLRMLEGQRAQDSINQLEAICNKLVGIAHNVPSDEKSIALLAALPPSWDQWVQLMESRAADPQALEFTTVCNLMIGEEQRRLANNGVRAAELAMAVSTKEANGCIRVVLGAVMMREKRRPTSLVGPCGHTRLSVSV